MAHITIETAAGEEYLRDWLHTLPTLFDQDRGTLLYQGRNEVRLFRVNGRQLVVKRFRRHTFLKRIVYSFFRKNKARRAFENAAGLRARGFHTPREVALLELRSCGTLSQVYYVSAYTACLPIRPRLIEQQPFDRELAMAYARYVASLHEAGVLHRDLNPTNVLFECKENSYRFELIDINRMQFYDGPLPKAESMENLTLFWWLSPVYRFVLETYAHTRSWTAADIDRALCVKQRHDSNWVLRKRIAHPLRKQPKTKQRC